MDGKMNERLEKQLAFALEIDKEKNIFRQTHLSGHGRRENDAEHAWHMAIMAFLLQEYANEEVDLLKVMKMILIHDVVEIDAGDTYAYDTEGLKSQAEREKKAADRIFNILPEDQAREMFDLFEEFEAGTTPEARYAKALDNIQPIMLNDASDGRDWREKGIKISWALERQRKTAKGSQVLWDEFSKPLLQRNIDRGAIIGDISLDEF